MPAEEAAHRCKSLVRWWQRTILAYTTTPCRVRLGRRYLLGGQDDAGGPGNLCYVPDSSSTPCRLVHQSHFQLLCEEEA